MNFILFSSRRGTCVPIRHHAPTICLVPQSRIARSPIARSRTDISHLYQLRNEGSRFYTSRQEHLIRCTPKQAFHSACLWSQKQDIDFQNKSLTTSSDPSNIARQYIVPKFTRRAIQRIFGTTIDEVDGNDLLRILQKHRETGHLEEDLNYPQDAIDAGLKFLRKRYRVDEDAALCRRIDEDILSGLALAGSDSNGRRTSESQFDKLRALRKTNELRKKRRDNAISASGESQTKGPRTLKNLIPRDANPLIESAWVKAYRERAESRTMPNLSAIERLVPSGLFSLAVVALSICFALSYTMPASSARYFPQLNPAVTTLIGVLSINVLIFLAWRFPPLWTVLNRYFIAVPLHPRPISMLLAEFSHQSFRHLSYNMVLMWFIGLKVFDDIGRGPFIGLVCSSAVLASYASLSAFVYRNYLTSATLGASGIIFALIGTCFTLYEGRHITLSFLPKEYTSAWNTGVFLVLLLGRECWLLRRGGLANSALVAKQGYATDHVGHIAGMLTGFSAGMVIRRYDEKWATMERRSFWYRFSKNERLDDVRRNKP